MVALRLNPVKPICSPKPFIKKCGIHYAAADLLATPQFYPTTVKQLIIGSEELLKVSALFI